MQKDVISLLGYPNELTAGQNKYSYSFRGHSVFFQFPCYLISKANKTKRGGEQKRQIVE